MTDSQPSIKGESSVEDSAVLAAQKAGDIASKNGLPSATIESAQATAIGLVCALSVVKTK